MKTMIIDRLRILSGLPFVNAGRAGSLVWFSFGETTTIFSRNGSSRTVGMYTLNVQCTWRITNEDEIVVASKDIFEPSTKWEGEVDEEFDWDLQGMNRFDEKIEELNSQKGLRIFVESIKADHFGGLTLNLSEDYVLELFPDGSSEIEFWRFLKRGDIDSHFVVTGTGIEE
ncbi:MAG: hypothetical protein ACXVP2_07560 [Tumebacillaceae bacterium]